MKFLGRIVQFVWGCRHQPMSGVFTIKKRAYRVCLVCGREFGYSGPLLPSRDRFVETRQAASLRGPIDD